MTEVLLPCPFCGGVAMPMPFTATISCDRCGAEIDGDREGIQGAIAAWNHRTAGQAGLASNIPEQPDRLRGAAQSSIGAGNSELEPDDRQDATDRSPDRQGRAGRQIGGRTALLSGGMQRGERDLRSEDGSNDVTDKAQGSETCAETAPAGCMSELHPIFAQVLDSHAKVTEAVTPAVNCFGIPNTYRGWTIEQGPDDNYYGTGPNYDASYEGPEDGWVDNGERCCAPTWDSLRDEIDTWFEDQEAARAALAPLSQSKGEGARG